MTQGTQMHILDLRHRMVFCVVNLYRKKKLFTGWIVSVFFDFTRQQEKLLPSSCYDKFNKVRSETLCVEELKKKNRLWH